MALKWYFVTRVRTLEPVLSVEHRVGRGIRNGCYVGEGDCLGPAFLHFFVSPVHSTLCESVDYRERAGAIWGISSRLLE